MKSTFTLRVSKRQPISSEDDKCQKLTKNKVVSRNLTHQQRGPITGCHIHAKSQVHSYISIATAGLVVDRCTIEELNGAQRSRHTTFKVIWCVSSL